MVMAGLSSQSVIDLGKGKRRIAPLTTQVCIVHRDGHPLNRNPIGVIPISDDPMSGWTPGHVSRDDVFENGYFIIYLFGFFLRRIRLWFSTFAFSHPSADLYIKWLCFEQLQHQLFSFSRWNFVKLCNTIIFIFWTKQCGIIFESHQKCNQTILIMIFFWNLKPALLGGY